MGAEFLSNHYKYCTKQELEEQVTRDTEQMANEYGCEYSGTWASKDQGIIYLDQVFTSLDEANDQIYCHNDKWGPLWACKVVISEPSTGESNKLKAAESQFFEARDSIPKLEQSIINSMRNVKATRRTCKSCTSAIATNFINSLNCPVCGNKLCSPTDHTRLKSAHKKLERATTNLQHIRSTSKAEMYWVVGGNCSS